MAKEITVTIHDLQILNPAISLNKDGLRMKLVRGRSGGSEWRNYKDAQDKRIARILYGYIDTSFKNKYELPDASEVTRVLAERKAAQERAQKADVSGGVSFQHQRQLERLVEQNYCKHISSYFETYRNQEEAKTKAREHALRLAVVALWQEGHTIKEIRPAYLALSQTRTVANYTRLTAEIKIWAEQGVNLVHGHQGKSREENCKFTSKHKAMAEEFYSHPNGFSSITITEYMNKRCLAQGLAQVSDRTVRKYLENPEVKNRLMKYRNRELFNKTVQPFNRRKKAFFAGDLYYLDGSPLQIPCLDRAGDKVIRPTLFIAMDMHSGKIPGFAIAETEDRFTWIAAMKMAFDMEKLLPAQIIYDNASATGTEEFNALKTGLEVLGCMLNPAKKGNPTAKANIERWFDSFQNQYQRLVDGFIGEGIKSRRANGRVDAEWLQKVKKVNGNYTFDGLVEIASFLVAAYNQKKTPRRAAPTVVFAESKKPNAFAITPEKLATLFWKHKTIKVNRGEVAMTIRHNEYFYEVYDHEQVIALSGTQVKVYYDETDLSQVHIFTLEGDYLAELRQKVAFAAAAANQTEEDVKQIIKQTSHKKAISTTIDKKTKKVAAAIADDMLSMVNPLQSLKDEFNTAETAMMMGYIRDNHNTREGDADSRQRVEQDAVFSKEEKAPDYSKKYIVPGTLQVVGVQER